MIRGTRPDRYSSEPSSRAFTHAMKPGPNRNVQLYMATRAWLAPSASAPAPAWRSVTTDNKATTPVTMMAASRVREPTNPSATPWFCRLITGYSATAVPIQAKARSTSSRPANRIWVSAESGAEDVARVGPHRAEQHPGRYRGGEGDQVQRARGQRGLPQRAHRTAAFWSPGRLSAAAMPAVIGEGLKPLTTR